MRHKHADMIIEWAETGKPVQYKHEDSDHWLDCHRPPEWNEEFQYRFKPEVVKYRAALFSNAAGRYYTYTVEDEKEARDIENQACFVKWIDTEWQEVEV